MVFPSIPVYLDPPNWNQHQVAHQHGSGRDGGGEGEIGQLPPGLAAPRPEGGAAGAAGAMIRPGSMSDRARLAKIPQPEPGLKCPRCDSTNTKFCYFNNYSLSQPRHFCKTCRRYWTRGGALRSVPVGGGCRRNKRTKSSIGNSSKTTTTASTTQTGASSSSSTATSAGIGGAIASATQAPLPFMSSLHPLPDFAAAHFGMSFAGIQQGDALDYQLGVGGGAGFENLRLQQIPQFSLLGGLDLPLPPPPSTQVSGLYPFVGEGSSFVGQLQTKPTGSGIITQMASVKMEDSRHQQQHQQPLFNLPRQYVGVSRSDQFWNTESSGGGGGGSGSGGWAPDLSGFNPSSGNII